MNDTDLDSYPQIGGAEPTDSYQPGTGKQRLDLDEYYKETQQDDVTVMVQGFEAMSFGKISKDLARLCGIEGIQNFDPFPSERNARNGSEGFFSAIAEKFESMIENIIKYVRMVIDWVVDTIGGFLGFRKKSKITAESSEKEKSLKKDFETTLIALGFPVATYNLEAYLKDLPTNAPGPFQLIFMKSKLTSDQEAIEGIANALPLLQQAVAKLKMASDKATNAQKYLKKVIGEEHKRIHVRKQTGQHVGAVDSTELNRVLKAILDVKSNLDTKAIATTVNKLYEALYKTKFNDEELATGYNKVREDLKKQVVTQKISMTGGKVEKTMQTIQQLNKRYLEISDKELDLSSIKWKDIGSIVDRDDASKVKALDAYFQGAGLQGMYTDMGAEVRNFVQYCLSVTNSMMTVEKQASNLIEWHAKATAFYYNGVIGEAKELVKIAESAPNLDDQQELKRQIKKMGKLKFINEPEAETLQEVLGRAGAGEKIKTDLKAFDTRLNNFAKQIGWGA